MSRPRSRQQQKEERRWADAFHRAQAEARWRDREDLKRILDTEEKAKKAGAPPISPQPHNIVLQEHHCPECKHRLWTELSLAKNCECSICGFQGEFRKRKD